MISDSNLKYLTKLTFLSAILAVEKISIYLEVIEKKSDDINNRQTFLEDV
jgi:hypothetical protein